MSSLNPRNRIVVFRLTQEEYANLQAACRSKGGRNLSEFTRSELMVMVRSEPIEALVEKHFQEIDGRLMQLDATVAQLAELLAGAGGHR